MSLTRPTPAGRPISLAHDVQVYTHFPRRNKTLLSILGQKNESQKERVEKIVHPLAKPIISLLVAERDEDQILPIPRKNEI